MKDLFNKLLIALTISVSAVYAYECCEQPNEGCSECCEQPSCCQQSSSCEQPSCCQQSNCCEQPRGGCCGQPKCCQQPKCCEQASCCEQPKKECCEQADDGCCHAEPIKGKAAISAFGCRGNSSSENVEFELKLKQKFMCGGIPLHEWSLKIEYDYDHNGKNGNTNKGLFQGYYEYRFYNPWALRLEEEISFNEPQGLKFRSDAFVALGYYLIETCDSSFELLAGVGHEDSFFSQKGRKKEKFDEHDFEFDLGWELEWTFANKWKFEQEFEYAPAFRNFNDYRVYFDNELTIPISECWGIGLEFEYTFLSQVPHGKRHADTTLSLKLTYDF